MATFVFTGMDRRKDPRLPAVENQAWLQWSDSSDNFGAEARLLNISRGGAMLVSCAGVEPGQTARIYLDGLEDDPGLTARVLGVAGGYQGEYQVRLQFEEPCPDRFFLAVAHGLDAIESGRPVASSRE